MALINCKECNNEFSTLAAACPKCGAPTAYSTGVEKLPAISNTAEITVDQDHNQTEQPARYEQTNIHHHHSASQQTSPFPAQPQINIHHHTQVAPEQKPQIRYISTLLFLGVIFFPLIFYWFLFRQGHTTFARVVGGIWLALCLYITLNGFTVIDNLFSQSSTQKLNNNLEEAALSIDVLQLSRDYQRNEISADEKYKGKSLLVTGIVDSIGKDFSDKAYVQLSTDNMFMPVMARLQASEMNRASDLNKGQWVIVKCVGGGMIAGSPILSSCSISDSQLAKVSKPSASTAFVTDPPHSVNEIEVPVEKQTIVEPIAEPVFEDVIQEIVPEDEWYEEDQISVSLE